MAALTERGLGTRTLIMGVLNVTPDSFSDGGQFETPDRALRRAIEMVEQGADIIDIGGESTRPATFHDDAPLDPAEELRRILPAIRQISRELPGFPISVDTYKADVAEQALGAGATIINDISGLTYDARMIQVAASIRCPVVVMHLLGSPRSIGTPHYTDIMAEISDFFRRQIAAAVSGSVDEANLIIDPGIGFGKNIGHNLEILRRLAEFKKIGSPILIGPSRKAFIGKILGDAPTEDRLEGTSAAIAISIANGADIVRVHDVSQIARVVKVADAIVRGLN